MPCRRPERLEGIDLDGKQAAARFIRRLRIRAFFFLFLRRFASEPHGGPLLLIARQYREARGLHRAILPLPMPAKAARGMGFCVAQGSRGALSWSTWLRRRLRG